MTISYTSEEEGHLNYYRAEDDDSLLQPSPYRIVPTYASAGTEVKEIQVGIKLSDKQIEKAEAAGFLAWEKAGEPGESYLWERRYVADAATAHALREATDLLVKHDILARVDGQLASVFEDFYFAWQALLAEAGIEEARE